MVYLYVGNAALFKGCLFRFPRFMLESGVAAEVIGIPSGSVGEKLYEAKIYLQTPELFAWTLTIILLSVWFEKIFLFIIDHVIRVE